MFGFIKKLIAGIIGFITGLLPGKKGGGYYLELKEEEPTTKPAPASNNGTKPAPAVAAAPAPAPKPEKPAKAEPTPVPTETNFATKYLIPTAANSNGRRRPGANMGSFLDMAKEVKIVSKEVKTPG
jgi:hypothetical protein